MKRIMFTLMGSVAIVLATASSAFACIFLAHQPKTPKSLQK